MANLIYRNREATLFFLPAAAAQAETAILEVDALSAGAGIGSGNHDLGEGAIARIYEWVAFAQFDATPAVGEAVDIYLKTSGNSASATIKPLNDDGYAVAVSAADKLNNLHFIGSIVIDEAAANIETVARGTILIDARAVSVVWFNNTAAATTSDVDENGFYLSPAPDEIQ